MLPLEGSCNDSKPFYLRLINARCSLEARLICLILLRYSHSTVKLVRGLMLIDVNLLNLRLRKLRFLLLVRSIEESWLFSRSNVVILGSRVCSENSVSLVHLRTRVVASWNFAGSSHSLSMVFLNSYSSCFFICSFWAAVKTEERSTWYSLLSLLILLNQTLFVFGGSPS